MMMAAQELGDADWRTELMSLAQSDGRRGTSVCEEMPAILTTSGSTEAATMVIMVDGAVVLYGMIRYC